MPKHCPQCQQPLNEIERWGVRLDVCQRCQGVWLEAGELEQIIGFIRASLANTNPQSMLPNNMGHHHDHDDDEHEHADRHIEYDQYGKPRRKRRFEISDIFDIFG